MLAPRPRIPQLPLRITQVKPFPKSAYIFRGLPGSGKTFLANYIASVANMGKLTTHIASADHYFLDAVTGEYKFDGSKIGRAHAACLKSVIGALKRGADCIIVENTNSCTWEYSNYLELLALHGYTCKVFEMYVPAEDDALLRACHGRTVHSVPLTAAQAMRRRWEVDFAAELVAPEFSTMMM